VIEPQGMEGNTPQQPLLGHLETETWLAERLKQHGCDLYAAGPFAHFRDRLRATILANRMQAVIVGRNKAGTLENYAQAFERLYGEPLVPRVTRNTQHQTP
jgi:hypothetical protein